MYKRIVITISLVCAGIIATAWGQKVGTYIFARTPQLMNYDFGSNRVSYTGSVSAGIGLYHKTLFLELAAITFEGNSYGYYTFFGITVKSKDLGPSFKLNTNIFGEVATLPSQQEIQDPLWIYTSGICFFLNVQMQRINAGIAICSGLTYQHDAFSLNNRFILNVSYFL